MNKNNHFKWKHKFNYRNFYGGEKFVPSNDDTWSLCLFWFTKDRNNLIAVLWASLGNTDFNFRRTNKTLIALICYRSLLLRARERFRLECGWKWSEKRNVRRNEAAAAVGIRNKYSRIKTSISESDNDEETIVFTCAMPACLLPTNNNWNINKIERINYPWIVIRVECECARAWHTPIDHRRSSIAQS